MARVIKRHIFKNGKEMYVDRIAYANGEFISLDDFDTEIQSINNEIARLNNSLEEIDNYYCEYKKQAQEKIAELESELEAKDNLLKIKNGLCKPPMMTVVVAKTINGQDYVRLEDFISVVNDLQNYDLYNAE